MLWGAVSPAVRIPAVGETTATFVNSVLGPGEGANTSVPPLQVLATTDPDQPSETLLTYEMGGRLRLGERVSLEPSIFHGVYDDLASFEVSGTTADLTANLARLTTTIASGNAFSGGSLGVELAATPQPLEAWWIRLSYSNLNIDPRAVGRGKY